MFAMNRLHNLRSGYILIGSLCNAYIQSHIINSFILSLAFFLEADNRFDSFSISSLSFVGDHKYKQGGGYMEQKHEKPNMDKSKSDEAICKKDEFDKEKTAVALSYNPADAAPKVIASGKGFVAERIIQRAMETDIPIHKDEQLAHSLSKLEIGEMIPPQLYDVVAEVLVFVDKMDRIRQKVNAHEQ